MSESQVTSAIVHATETDFDTLTAGSPLVLVKFGAAWCPPCRQMGPFVELFARLYAGRVLVVEVNKDDAPTLSERFGVNGIPHVVVMRDGVAGENFAGFYGDVTREKVRNLLFGAGAAEEQSPAEIGFAALSAAAAADFEAANAAAENSPEVQAFNRAYRPRAQAYRVALVALQEELNNGNIDQAAFDARLAELRKPLQEYQESPEFQALLAGYKEVQLRGETAYVAAISAAVEQFFPLKAAAPAASAEASTETLPGAVCQIGDPACHS